MDPRIVAAIIGGVAVVASGVAGFIGALVGAAVSAVARSFMAQRQRRHEEAIAEEEYRQRLRMAALDRRLEVHQEGYSLWHELVWASGRREQDTLLGVVKESREWWQDNCLYLDRSVRGPFRACVNLATTRQEVLAAHAEAELVESIYQKMMEVGPLIEEAVGLPAIADGESWAPDRLEKGDAES